MDPMMAAAGIIPSLIGGKQLGPMAPAIMPQAAATGALTPQVTSGLLGAAMQQMSQGEPDSSDLVAQKRDEKRPNFFGGFFENLDQGFQSPSRMIGLGLLNQIDPRLAMGGAAVQGLGLLGGKRLF